jgi:hypothetical protein
MAFAALNFHFSLMNLYLSILRACNSFGILTLIISHRMTLSIEKYAWIRISRKPASFLHSTFVGKKVLISGGRFFAASPMSLDFE